MCGICGWLNTDCRIDINIFMQMNNIVRHRGPDDEGYALVDSNGTLLFRGADSCDDILPLLSDKIVGPSFLAFGHRRLSILDLSAKGHQPMCSKDEQLCVTFNGEIYNYIELRQELSVKGYNFRSGSDTEVLLAAYQAWGEDCVRHFNGMWGFAIWDAERQRLFCSRDRLGAKPIYYYRDDKNFLFSSEIKQLCKNPIVPRVMNDNVVMAQIMWGISDYSNTCWLEDINVLQGGYNLVLDLACNETCKIKGVRIYKYWDIDTACGKDETAIARAMEIHKDAVRIRTRSDVPIGIMLSGGLDSSTLVADVSEYCKETGRETREINTFTSCYENYLEGDESEFAHAVNEYCATTENFIFPKEQDTLSIWEKMIWHMEGAAWLNALGAFMMLREIGRMGQKVLLNGQGSDETMFGYERYYAWYLRDIFEKQGLLAFLGEWNKVANNSRLSRSELSAYIAYFLNYPVRKIRNFFRMKKYASSFLLKLFDDDKKLRQFITFKSMDELQYNELRGTQLTHILHGDDRMYMAFSIESRVPFIDYRYIEEAVKIPVQLKIIDGYTKYPLRKYAEGRLPDSVVWRRNKLGWPSPRERWIDCFDKKRVKEMLKNPRSEQYFNLSTIRGLWEKNPYHYAIEQFLNVEIFMRLFAASVGE